MHQYLPPSDLFPNHTIQGSMDDFPESLNLAEELLDCHIHNGRASCKAILFGKQAISYEEVSIQVNKLGNRLLQIGIRPRDRIGIRMTTLPQALIANFAILKIGAIPVPMSPLWSKSEIIYVSEDAELKGLFLNKSLVHGLSEYIHELSTIKFFVAVDDYLEEETTTTDNMFSFEDMVEQGMADLEPYHLKGSDIAILLYTSGTTGPPKGCAHTAAGVLMNARRVTQYVWDLKEDDVLGGSAPISFAAGYGTFCIIPWTSSGAVSLLDKFTPDALLENIENHKITVLTGIPTAYRKMLEAEHFDEYDLSSLRLCTAGADAVGKATFNAWMNKTGLPIWENYGATEFFNIIISTRMGSHPVRGSLGLPLNGYKVKVVNESGKPCMPFEVGSLWVKGPTGIVYWNPFADNGRLMAAQRKSVRDGWSIVGDAVHRDEMGYVYFVSREDDMIKSSGYRLCPAEIEETLVMHPAIREAAVFGVKDKTKEQVVKACIVSNVDVGNKREFEEEIREYCRDHLAVYKIPRIFQFVSELPKSAIGKVSRKDLSNWAKTQTTVVSV